jgi:hypothetical protein
LTATATFIFLSSPVAYAEYAGNISIEGVNANLIILTPGHSRTIFYELHDIIYNDIRALHTAFIIAPGPGTLTVSIANTTPVGQGSEILYSTTGFIGLTPVLDYAYGSSPINMSMPVTGTGLNVGLLFTGVIAGIGNPDFPVTMSMTFFFTS